MRILGGVAIALVAGTGLVAQNRGAFVNTAPMSRSLGVTVYPGTGVAVPRAPSMNPFPAGSALSPITVPLGSVTPPRSGNFNRGGIGRRSGSNVVAYPVYIGGGYGYGYYDPSYYSDPTSMYPQQQQPNVTVIMPPQQPPMIINLGNGAAQAQGLSIYPPQAEEQTAQSQTAMPAPETQTTNPYLIALKDHTIYSAIAYWVDGDTVHYFTSGNTHNQVSVSLIDRPLTERLNREMGVEFKLPPAK